ncbi:hypothetical protein BJY04DRAFT_222976 [Aspergillus karnatakaensis]|uniref:uncharacterized protein n=1 Tax=Aspergillus karnatakaensis TaxID=1810916 RepID=UPI003CCD42F1
MPPLPTEQQHTDQVGEDIKTTLTYWHSPPNTEITIDLRDPTPGTAIALDNLIALQKQHAVTIHDIRATLSQYIISRNGFQYISDQILAPAPAPEYDGNTPWDTKTALSTLLPRTEGLVRKLFKDPRRILVYAHRIRESNNPSTSASAFAPPIHLVHADFTPAGARNHLRSVISPSEYDALSNSNERTRIVALNTWRPLGRVYQDPLALCDVLSTKEEDFITTRFVFGDGWVEGARMRVRGGQRWVYCSGMRVGDVIGFVQGGFTLGGCGCEEQSDNDEEKDWWKSIVAHSAFKIPGVDPELEKRGRRSLEVGVFVFI